jgi:hypothetical protein
MLAAIATEQDDFCADIQAQHPGQVICGVTGQHYATVIGQLAGEENAGLSHERHYGAGQAC